MAFFLPPTQSLLPANLVSRLALESAKQPQASGPLYLFSLLGILSWYNSKWFLLVTFKSLLRCHLTTVLFLPPLPLLIPLPVFSFAPRVLTTMHIINVDMCPAFPTTIYRSYRKAVILTGMFPAALPTPGTGNYSVTNWCAGEKRNQVKGTKK